MSRAEKCGLVVGLAVLFGAWYGLAGGLPCGVLGVLVGGMLGAVIR